METTLKVTKETARRVQKAKYALGCKTADQTINDVFDIVEEIQSIK